MSPLTLAVAQPVSRLGDIEFNVAEHCEQISEVSADVVVFPELSLTGYSMEAPLVDPSDHLLAPLVEACGREGSVALVGAPTSDGCGGAHISILRVDGDGVEPAYDKMWLGADEEGSFKPGTVPSVVEVNGWRLGLGICKDTGIREQAAITAALEIEVYVAGLCDLEIDEPVQANRGLRIAEQHGLWVGFASFAGPTGAGFLQTAGRSRIWRPDGSVAVSLGRAPGQVAVAVLHR